MGPHGDMLPPLRTGWLQWCFNKVKWQSPIGLYSIRNFGGCRYVLCPRRLVAHHDTCWIYRKARPCFSPPPFVVASSSSLPQRLGGGQSRALEKNRRGEDVFSIHMCKRNRDRVTHAPIQQCYRTESPPRLNYTLYTWLPLSMIWFCSVISSSARSASSLPNACDPTILLTSSISGSTSA